MRRYKAKVIKLAFLVTMCAFCGLANADDSNLSKAHQLVEEVMGFEPGVSKVPNYSSEISIHKSLANFEIEEARRLLKASNLDSEVREIYQNNILAHSSEPQESIIAEEWLVVCARQFAPELAIRCSIALADIALVSRKPTEVLTHALSSLKLLSGIDENSEFYLFGKFLVAEWLYLALLHDKNFEGMVSAAQDYVLAAKAAGIPIEPFHIINNVALLLEAEFDSLEALKFIQMSVPDVTQLSTQDQESILFSLSRSSMKANEFVLAEQYLEQLKPVLSNDQLVLAHQYMSAFVYAKNGKTELSEKYIKLGSQALSNELDNKRGLYILEAKKELFISSGKLLEALVIDDRIDTLKQTLFDNDLSAERTRISRNILVTNEKLKAQEEQIKFEQQLLDQEQLRQRIFVAIAVLLSLLSIMFAVYQKRNRDKVNGLNEDLESKNVELNVANVEINSAHDTLNKTYEELKVAHKQALAGQDAKEKFIGVVGHELRTPLNPIINLAAILEQKAEDKQDRALLKAIKNAGKRLHIIVENMLIVSADDDRSKIFIEPVNVVDNLSTIIREFSSEIENRNVELHQVGKKLNVKLRKSKSFNVLQSSNKVIFRIIVRNIFDNALKFTRDGDIDIQLMERKQGDGFVLSIRDTGLGMDAAKLQDLFEPFKQGDMSLNRNHEGAGLGLAVVKKYCDQLGAKIDIQSQVNVGTRVCIEFPEPKFEETTGELIQIAA